MIVNPTSAIVNRNIQQLNCHQIIGGIAKMEKRFVFSTVSSFCYQMRALLVITLLVFFVWHKRILVKHSKPSKSTWDFMLPQRVFGVLEAASLVHHPTG
jgi:hypothetical protein